MNLTPGDRRVRDLVRAGLLRFGVFPSFFYQKTSGGESAGIAIDIAAALAATIDVKLACHEYCSPPDVVSALAADECDVAFLGIDAVRAAHVDFSRPCMQADFSFLVPPGSTVRTVTEADTPRTRIAVVRNHAMDAALTSKITKAQRVYAATPDAAFALLRGGQADILAGIRPGLAGYAQQLSGARVLADRYGANTLALGVAKGRPHRLAFIDEFVGMALATGLLKQAVISSALVGIDVPGSTGPKEAYAMSSSADPT